MKRRRGRFLTAALLLVIESTIVSEIFAAGSPKSDSGLTVHVYNYAGVDQGSLLKSERVAAGIYRPVGVEIQWIMVSLDSLNQPETFAESGWEDGSHIQLNILPQIMAERFGLPDDKLGFVPGKGSGRHQAFVFNQFAEDLARRQRAARLDGELPRNADAAQILGHAIAHEIGHLLLNLTVHSPVGIMRGNWELRDLNDIAYGYLLFTPRQAEVIRAEVDRRRKQQRVVRVAAPALSR